MFAIIKGQGRDRVNFLWENFFAVIRDHGCVSSKDNDSDLGIPVDLFIRDFDLLFEALRLLASAGNEPESRVGSGGSGGVGSSGERAAVTSGFRSATLGSTSSSVVGARKVKARASVSGIAGLSDLSHVDESISRDWVRSSFCRHGGALWHSKV